MADTAATTNGATPEAAAAPPALASGMGFVWNVLSGDTLEVCVNVKNGQATFKKITLAGIIAPKLAVGAGSKDEPGAWASKEFLRKLVIGKKVQFRQFYESGGRSFNECRIVGETTHLGVKMAEAGFARIAPGKQVKELPFYSELEASAESALNSALGLNSSAPENTMVRDLATCHTAVVDNFEFDLDQWYANNKGKERMAIVDFVKDAGAFRMIVYPSEDPAASAEDKKYVSIMASISGIQNPTIMFKKDEGGEVEATPGSGAFFARSFAQERLLGRELKIRLESLDKNPQRGYNFLCSMMHPVKGSIAEFFLDAGFATYVDWSAVNSVSGPDKLKDAQKRAQDGKKGKWKNWNGEGAGMDNTEFNGKVVEICSGDVMRIINTESKVERRYYISSVRAPQLNRGTDAEKTWAEAAVEFMRKKCIGKTFKVRVDYKKNISIFKGADGSGNSPPPSDEATGDMYFVSLYDNNKENACIGALKAGLMKTLASRGPESQNERSRDFEEMKAAELEAEGKEAGQFGSVLPKTPVYTQLVLAPGMANSSKAEESESPQKKKNANAMSQNVGVPRGNPTNKKQLVERAKAFEEQLKAKRAGHDGIVTFIMNGSRMRLKLVHEKILMTFQMDGVRAPNAERVGGANLNVPKAEPFGNESLAFAREMCMQQDVKVVVNRVDPSGTFIGQIFIQKAGKKEDLATLLLEQGLAYCDAWNQNQGYFASEATAKKAGINYWSVPHADAAADAAEAASAMAAKAGKPIKGEIYHINSVNSFYLVPSGGEPIKIMNEVQKAAKDSSAKNCDKEGPNRPRKNRLYLAQHWEDKKFYRAKYEGNAEDPRYAFSMFFIDTGMTMDCDVVKEIPNAADIGNLTKVPAQAQHCSLYGVRTTDEFEYDAAEAFFNKTNKKVVSGVVEGVFYDNGVLTQKVTIGTNNGTENVQLALLKDAVVRLTRKEKSPAQYDYKAWSKEEQLAKRNHTKLWQYGDVGSDDEDY